jgi:hypothetical protein
VAGTGLGLEGSLDLVAQNSPEEEEDSDQNWGLVQSRREGVEERIRGHTEEDSSRGRDIDDGDGQEVGRETLRGGSGEDPAEGQVGRSSA